MEPINPCGDSPVPAGCTGFAQTPVKPSGNATAPPPNPNRMGSREKAAEWVQPLGLADPAKEARDDGVIATHLKTIRDWHNEHPLSTVPAGINPVTGIPLSNLDRQVIADSAIPKSVHENLMMGLRRDLSARAG